MDDTDVFLGTRVYPNPVVDQLVIALAGSMGRTEYQLTDATGRTVMTGVLLQERGILDVGGLAKGAYLLTLRNGSGMWNTRVMVQR